MIVLKKEIEYLRRFGAAVEAEPSDPRQRIGPGSQDNPAPCLGRPTMGSAIGLLR